jgi:hypothetical protein
MSWFWTPSVGMSRIWHRFALRGREMCVHLMVAGLQHCKIAFWRVGTYFFRGQNCRGVRWNAAGNFGLPLSTRVVHEMLHIRGSTVAEEM